MIPFRLFVSCALIYTVMTVLHFIYTYYILIVHVLTYYLDFILCSCADVLKMIHYVTVLT